MVFLIFSEDVHWILLVYLGFCMVFCKFLIEIYMVFSDIFSVDVHVILL